MLKKRKFFSNLAISLIITLSFPLMVSASNIKDTPVIDDSIYSNLITVTSDEHLDFQKECMEELKYVDDLAQKYFEQGITHVNENVPEMSPMSISDDVQALSYLGYYISATELASLLAEIGRVGNLGSALPSSVLIAILTGTYVIYSSIQTLKLNMDIIAATIVKNPTFSRVSNRTLSTYIANYASIAEELNRQDQNAYFACTLNMRSGDQIGIGGVNVIPIPITLTQAAERIAYGAFSENAFTLKRTNAEIVAKEASRLLGGGTRVYEDLSHNAFEGYLPHFHPYDANGWRTGTHVHKHAFFISY